MQPLINSPRSVHENIGTVVNLELFDTASVQGYSIGNFRQRHPALTIALVYGVFVAHYPDSPPGLGHGDFLRISGRGNTRFYWWPTGNMHVDELLIKRQMVLDWEENLQPQPRQIHWPDLCWFNPPKGAPGWKEAMTPEALGTEIGRRLRALDV